LAESFPAFSAFTDLTVSVAPGKSGEGLTLANVTGPGGTVFTLSVAVAEPLAGVLLLPQDVMNKPQPAASNKSVPDFIKMIFASKIMSYFVNRLFYLAQVFQGFVTSYVVLHIFILDLTLIREK